MRTGKSNDRLILIHFNSGHKHYFVVSDSFKFSQNLIEILYTDNKPLYLGRKSPFAEDIHLHQNLHRNRHLSRNFQWSEGK